MRAVNDSFGRKDGVLRSSDLVEKRISNRNPIESYLHDGGPKTSRLASMRTRSHPQGLDSFNPYQKCTVFTPTGLFHMRWKVLCCSAAPASELEKRKPWAPGRRNGAEALRNAKRVLFKKRKPTREDIVVVEMEALVRGRRWMSVIGGSGRGFPSE